MEGGSVVIDQRGIEIAFQGVPIVVQGSLGQPKLFISLGAVEERACRVEVPFQGDADPKCVCRGGRKASCRKGKITSYEPVVFRALLTLLKVLFALVPRAVIERIHATMIRASMTAYSTAVGPFSLVRNRTTNSCTILSMRNLLAFVRKRVPGKEYWMKAMVGKRVSLGFIPT
jgi:hypothetical protein